MHNAYSSTIDTSFNPFLVTGYAGPEYFCNREEETSTIVEACQAGRNVTLMGIRRIGKTGLIRHVFNQLRKEYLSIYVDLLPTNNVETFTDRMASAILRQFPSNFGPGRKIWDIIKSMRPIVSFDSLTGFPEVSLQPKRDQEKKMNLQEVLRILEQHKYPVLIALDEFQQIETYPEDWFEAMLRSEIQDLHNVYFIFSGSQPTLLTEMFGKTSRPFFQSTQMLSIDTIDSDAYCTFAQEHFQKAGRKIDVEAIDTILDWTRHHTFYVQSVLNRIFSKNHVLPDKSVIRASLNELLEEQEPVFFQYRELLTPLQWRLMEAIAKEDTVFQPTSKAFIPKYNLGTPASVSRALESLLEKEMVLKSVGKSGSSFQVYDVFLSRWLQTL